MNWKEKTTGDKVITILVMTCSILIIILAALQITGVWENAIYIFEPFMGMVLLLQAVKNWKEHRILAIFSLCAAAFIFVVAFIIIFMR